MGTALLVAAALVGVVVLLLAVPVHVAFTARGLDDLKARVTVRWLFGLVRVAHVSPSSGPPARRSGAGSETLPGARARPMGRSRPDRDRGRTRWLAVLRQPAFRRRVWQLLKDLVAATHPRGLRLWLRLGLGDPADTGRLWAVLGPVSALAQQLRHAEMHLEPAFVDAVFEFDAAGRLRVVPLQVLALGVAFALSPPSIRAWRTLGGADG